ncbi:MAG: glucosamine-6-phosphate isomerase [Spirochaetales bacterium]|nr:glucosamine-6-phosphate isomerase [Spirochaetales bacterium]
MHDYYSYDAEQLARNGKIRTVCMASSEQVFKCMAREMADEIISHNALGQKTVFILPVGPVGQYPFFVEIVNKERISLKDCWFFNMDEYLTDEGKWLDKDCFLSFRGFMETNVYSKINGDLVNPPSQRFFPDPDDPSAMTRKLEELGGADVCFGGIGINGHVAFNEPQPELSVSEFANLTTRVVRISDETKTANAIGDLGGAIEDMPEYAVTIGMKEILSSKKIRLGVFRTWHRAVVRRAVCGEITSEFPVSLLQKHPDSMIYVNDVASERAF